MERKTQMDKFGAVALTLFALNLAFNQVVIKITAGGFEPIFGAGVVPWWHVGFVALDVLA